MPRARVVVTKENYFWPEAQNPQDPAASAWTLAGQPQIHVLSDGRRIEVSSDGWAYTVNAQLESGRRQLAGIRAVLKDNTLWLLSVHGFWRMSLKNQRIIPVALPTDVLRARPPEFFPRWTRVLGRRRRWARMALRGERELRVSNGKAWAV